MKEYSTKNDAPTGGLHPRPASCVLLHAGIGMEGNRDHAETFEGTKRSRKGNRRREGTERGVANTKLSRKTN